MVIAVSGFNEQVNTCSVIKGISKHNYHPSTLHISIKLKRVTSTDTCQQVNLHRQFSSSELNNSQQMGGI